ncbi:MAG: S1C family serine protease [Planctomycetia bacterium]
MNVLSAVVVLSAASILSDAVGLKPAVDVWTNSAAKVVKLYGSGGLGRVEAYGSGCLVSKDGHVVTLLAPLLDTDELTVVAYDGRRLIGKFVAADAARQIAVLKVDADDLPYFDLNEPTAPQVGDVVLAFSNLFNVAAGDEPVSVQRGVLAVAAPLGVRQGVVDFTFKEPVYVVDVAANNPGSAGGALTDRRGRLIGLLGKEVRSRQTETWVHFALPTATWKEFVSSVVAGTWKPPSSPDAPKATDAPRDVEIPADRRRGLILVPDALDKTPPYIDAVEPRSPAAAAGLRADDLILFVDDVLTPSITEFRRCWLAAPAAKPIRLAVKRGDDVVVVDVAASVEPTGAAP